MLAQVVEAHLIAMYQVTNGHVYATIGGNPL
jgi:hypothetical protein